MTLSVSHFFESPGQVTALFSVAVIWFGFSIIGATVGGAKRMPEIDHLIGWSIVSAILTVFGVFAPISFTSLLSVVAALVLAGAIHVWRRDKRFLFPGWWRIIALGLPVLILVAAMRGSQWDDFGHWLMIPRYLIETDAFPSQDNPYTKAGLSAYPFGWHFISFIAGRIGGHLIESAGPLFNILLYFWFGVLVVRLVLMGSGREEDQPSALRPLTWGLAALAIMFTMLVNPTFAQKVVLTAYAETSSAVATGTAAILSWFIIEALINRDSEQARRLAWALGLTLALLVNLKQATLVLVVLVVLAMIFVGLRVPAVRKAELARLLPVIVIPSAIIYLSWRYHVSTELAGREFTIRSFDDWLIGYIPEIVGKMLLVLSKKGYYLFLALVMVIFGIYGFFRAESPLQRFAAIAALVFLGYNSFLLFAYVASFGKFDALRAASFWRYNMHLGMIVVAFSAYGFAVLWHNRFRHKFQLERLAALPVVLVLIAPFLFADKLRFDKAPWVTHFRAVGAEVAKSMGPEDKVYIADPKGSGESGVITGFELGLHPGYAGFNSAFYPDKIKSLQTGIQQTGVTLLLLHSNFDGYEDILKTPIHDNRSHLLRRADDGAWRIVKTWEHPTEK